MAPVAMVLPSNASATLLFAKVSAMIPEPTTVATKANVPNHSANSRFERSFRVIMFRLALAD
jgi:hypothetical protein